MKKTIIAREILINAPKEKVWSVISDFGNVYRVSRNVVKSYLTSDQKSGVGITRHCDLSVGGAEVEERVTEWNKENSLKIDIYESKNIPMTTNMNAVFSLKQNGNKTVLSGIFEYQMTNFIGDIMNAIMMKNANEKAWISVLAGIKHYTETGNPVEKETNLNTDLVKESSVN